MPHTAIECNCGNVIVYDTRLMTIVCPKCQRRWMQAPQLFGDDGTEANRLPYLCAKFANNPVSDAMLGAIATEIRRGTDNHNRHLEQFGSAFGGRRKTCPETFTAISVDGQIDEVPTSLKDFANETSYKIANPSSQPVAPQPAHSSDKPERA